MGLTITPTEAGTQLFLAFSPCEIAGTSLTMSMFTKDSIEVKIWANKHKCIAHTFINVEDLLNAANLFNKLKIDGLIKD